MTPRPPATRKTPPRRRILIVDDHPIFRQGLAQLINLETDLRVCGEVERASETVEAIEASRPDLVLVDISLQDGDGIELVKDLKARFPKLLTLILSMHDESLYAERGLQAGARGYLAKKEPSDVVIGALRRVLSGELHLSDHIKRRILERSANGTVAAPPPPMTRLSDRELQVFRLIGNGSSTGQISRKLHLSVSTIESYRAILKRKLGLRNAIELVRHAVQWVETEA
jgi:DNA-binding NarL/FixJ family response regulator